MIKIKSHSKPYNGLTHKYPVLGDDALVEKLLEISEKGELTKPVTKLTDWGMGLVVNATETGVKVDIWFHFEKVNTFIKETFKRANAYYWCDYGVHVAGPCYPKNFTTVFVRTDEFQDEVALTAFEPDAKQVLKVGTFHISKEEAFIEVHYPAAEKTTSEPETTEPEAATPAEEQIADVVVTDHLLCSV